MPKKTKTALSKKDKKKALLKKILAQLLKQKIAIKAEKNKEQGAKKGFRPYIPPKSHPMMPVPGGPYLHGTMGGEYAQLMGSEQPKPEGKKEEKKTEINIKQEPINLQPLTEALAKPFEELKQKFLLLEDRDRNYNENLISNYNRGVKEGYQNFFNLYNQNKDQAVKEGHSGLITQQPNTTFVALPQQDPTPLIERAASIENPPLRSLSDFGSTPQKYEQDKWKQPKQDIFSLTQLPEQGPTMTVFEEDQFGIPEVININEQPNNLFETPKKTKETPTFVYDPKKIIGATDITYEQFRMSPFFPSKSSSLELGTNKMFVITPEKGGHDSVSTGNKKLRKMIGKPDFDEYYTTDLNKFLQKRFEQFQRAKSDQKSNEQI